MNRAPLVTAEQSIVQAPRALGDWKCTRLGLPRDELFVARFERRTSDDWVEVEVVPRDTPGKVFQRFEHCAVRYRGALGAPDDALREQVRQLVLGVAHTVEARLAVEPGATIAEALGRRRESESLVFGRDTLRQMLAPTIVEGAVVADGWTLAEVYPSSYAQEALGQTLELVLDFRRTADGRRTLLVVSERSDKPCFARTAHFSLSYLALGGAEDDGADSLRALVAFALTLRDHEGLEITFPDVSMDVAGQLPAATKADAPSTPPADWLNLAISAECSQSCRFCTIKEMSPASDGGAALFARLSADMTAARGRGVTGVRINGYDPLAYSRIVEILRLAAELGFERAHVFSPCTLLADRAFCETIVECLPSERCIFVPVYAVSPELHDDVVGRPGAHALVMRALDHLVELAGAESVALLSVVTRDNLAEMPALLRFARERRLSFSAHMPYPSSESRADRYVETVPRQSEVAASFANHMQGLGAHPGHFPVHGVAPCVTFRAMQGAGVPLRAWLDVPERRPLLPGTEYKSSEFSHGAGRRESAAFVSASVPCPHEGACALALACPGELLRAYAEQYGLEEIAPVSLRDLLEAR